MGGGCLVRGSTSGSMVCFTQGDCFDPSATKPGFSARGIDRSFRAQARLSSTRRDALRVVPTRYVSATKSAAQRVSEWTRSHLGSSVARVLPAGHQDPAARLVQRTVSAIQDRNKNEQL
jgi:hypothetical protein